MIYTRKKSNCITDYAIMYTENPEVSYLIAFPYTSNEQLEPIIKNIFSVALKNEILRSKFNKVCAISA